MTLPDPRMIMTERLVLRPLSHADAEALHAAFGDADCVTYWSRPAYDLLEETAAFVAENVDGERFATWAITEAEGPDAGLALGWVTLVDVRPGVASIGYILRRDRWGRGYVTEAALPVVELGLGEWRLHRIQADIDIDNAASVAVMKKLGFSYEGRQRAAWDTHIGLRDSVIYVRLSPEAEAASARWDD